MFIRMYQAASLQTFAKVQEKYEIATQQATEIPALPLKQSHRKAAFNIESHYHAVLLKHRQPHSDSPGRARIDSTKGALYFHIGPSPHDKIFLNPTRSPRPTAR